MGRDDQEARQSRVVAVEAELARLREEREMVQGEIGRLSDRLVGITRLQERARVRRQCVAAGRPGMDSGGRAGEARAAALSQAEHVLRASGHETSADAIAEVRASSRGAVVVDDALAYIDKALDNVEGLDCRWENAEVVEMLREIRAALTPDGQEKTGT